MARKFTINLPATSFVPQAGTTGCQLVSHVVGNVPRTAMAFDNSTDEHAISQSFEWPSEYAGGTVKATIWFYSSTVGSGSNKEVVFNIALESETAGAGSVDMYDGGTAHTFTDNATSATTTGTTAGYVVSATVTLSGLDSVAAGDIVRVRLMRDVSADDLAEDAFVPLVSIYEEG